LKNIRPKRQLNKLKRKPVSPEYHKNDHLHNGKLLIYCLERKRQKKQRGGLAPGLFERREDILIIF